MAAAFTYFGLPSQDNEAETDDNQASTLCSKGLKIIKKVQKPVSISPTFYEQLGPKSFRQKITNPNCKHIEGAQRTLV